MQTSMLNTLFLVPRVCTLCAQAAGMLEEIHGIWDYTVCGGRAHFLEDACVARAALLALVATNIAILQVLHPNIVIAQDLPCRCVWQPDIGSCGKHAPSNERQPPCTPQDNK